MRTIRIGARTSPLARAQAEQVAALLTAAGQHCTWVGITTQGDVDRRHLTEIGGTGVFAQAVRTGLRTGEIDLAVHSLKDLPTAQPDDLIIQAVPPRADARDVLVGTRLADLGTGMRIGTGSPRRARQLQAWAARRGERIEVVPIRGNVDSRIGLVAAGQVDAVVLAAAGLRRLGRLASDAGSGSDRPEPCEVAGLPAELLDTVTMVPAAGQGALALEMSAAAPAAVQALIGTLDDAPTRAAVVAERTFLATLEAGCLAPAGAAARVRTGCGSDLDLTMEVVVGRTWEGPSPVGQFHTGSDPLDDGGQDLVRATGRAPSSEAIGLGQRLAHQLLTELGSTHDN